MILILEFIYIWIPTCIKLVQLKIYNLIKSYLYKINKKKKWYILMIYLKKIIECAYLILNLIKCNILGNIIYYYIIIDALNYTI